MSINHLDMLVRGTVKAVKKATKPKAKKKKPEGSSTRDYRGVDGVLDDAAGNANRTLQERDNP